MNNDVKRGMQKKTINRIINEKIDGWLKTIKFNKADLICWYGPLLTKNSEKKAVEMAIHKIKSDIIVTGGAIASMLMGDMPNDFDVYFKTKDVARFIAEYYMEQMASKVSSNDRVSEMEVKDNDSNGVKIMIKSVGVVSGDGAEVSDYQYFEGNDPDGNFSENYVKKIVDRYITVKEGSFDCVYMSSNAITLSDYIQVVLRFTGDAEKIHENFDFAHATSYWTAETGVVLNPKAMEAILTRRLVYIGSLFPVCSLFRIRKFIRRGFSISASEIFKIAWDINKLNLEDPNVLEDQLMGVDQAYFTEVLGILKGTNAFNPDKPLDRSYLFSILDKVFEEGPDE